MRTSRKTADGLGAVTDLAAALGESVGGLAADVKDRVAHGSDLLAEVVTAARHDLAELIEPTPPPPRRRWRWLLAGGVAAAVAVAIWAVLSRRPQVVEPVRAVPASVPPGEEPVDVDDASPSGVGARNGDSPA